MKNYEYIIASLPVLTQDGKAVSGTTEEDVINGILDLCDASDKARIAELRSGWDTEALDSAFYEKILKSRNRFIRTYYAYDLTARNAKVEYLNKALGRPEGMDVVSVAGFKADPAHVAELRRVLAADDLITREKGLDDACWKMIEETVLMELFSIDLILAFIAKLHIVCRWLKLDEQTGREMFRRLVDEVRGTFAGVDYKG